MTSKRSIDEIIPFLQKALEHTKGEYTLDTLLERIRNETLQLWDFPEAVVLTELAVFPTKTRVHVFLASGVYYPEYLQTIEKFARAIGADGVQWSGRRGWVRKTASEGYEETYSVMIKDFADE